MMTGIIDIFYSFDNFVHIFELMPHFFEVITMIGKRYEIV